jgi:hypothetical protein
MTPSKTWIAETGPWSILARVVFCAIAALLTGVDLALQGNSWIWIGFCVGLFVGIGWSAFLLFVIPPLVRHFRPSARAAFSRVSWLVAFIVVAVICFHIWGPR